MPIVNTCILVHGKYGLTSFITQHAFFFCTQGTVFMVHDHLK